LPRSKDHLVVWVCSDIPEVAAYIPAVGIVQEDIVLTITAEGEAIQSAGVFDAKWAGHGRSLVPTPARNKT
jgi:hypothetical protein